MDTITLNPFRVIGILANASERDLQQRKAKIQAFTRVNKSVDSDYDFSFLTHIERDTPTIEKAFSAIEQSQEKVKHALFWFVSANAIDQMAIEHLKNGNEDKAKEIWQKITESQNINAKNFSAFNNIATLWLLSKETTPKKSAIEYKIKLIESDFFTDFVHLVADQTVSIEAEKEVQIFANQLYNELKKTFNQQEALSFFQGTSAYNHLAKKITYEPIHLIETLIEKAEKDRKNTPRNAYKIGKNLYKQTQEPIATLKAISGVNDLNFKRLSDSVAKTIMQCSIDYVNELQEESEPFDQGMELLKLAQTLAVNNLTKERIKENIKTLEGMKDRELNQTVLFLKMIEANYHKNAREVMNAVKEQERTLGYGQSINWNKVENLIKNSMNWDKVIETLKSIVSKQDISKIKASQNTEQLREYRRLVEFLMDKFNYSQRREMEYLCYWKTNTSTVSNTSTTPYSRAKQASSSSSSIGSKYGCTSWIIAIVIIMFLTRMCS
ncbi:MAG: hypothetical protein Q4A09_00565 [Capnocytophaga felis]|nr:hypothetical protein [Capnocytophaga felis]